MDLNYQIGLDISSALDSMKELSLSIKKGFSEKIDNTSIKGMATDFNQLNSVARQSVAEQKAALAGLIATGKQGGSAYNELINSLKNSQTEAKKLEAAMKQVDNVLVDVPKKTGGVLNSLQGVGSTILGVFGGGALLGGVQGLLGGFKEIVSKGIAAEEKARDLKIAFSQAGLSGDELSKQLKRAGSEATDIGNRFGVTAGSVKDVQKQAALLGGVFGDQNKRITELAVGIDAITKSEISTTDVIKAFTKGGSEGSESLGRLTMKFPALAEQLKGIKDPAEKSQKALDFLKGSFDQFSDSPTVAIARLKNSFSSLVGGIAVNVVELFKPLLTVLNDTLVPALQSVSKFIKSAFENIKPLAPIVSGLAAGIIAITIATTAWTAAQVLLNSSIWATTAALLANPIGLIIAGLVALGVGLVVAYKNFEGFRNIVNSVWDSITAGAKIMWSFISNYFMSGFDVIKTIIGTGLKVVSAIMKGDFTGAWDSLKSGATEVGGVIKDRVTNVVNDTKNAVGEVGKKQAEHTAEAKKTSTQMKEIVTDVKDISDEMVKAGNKFTEAFDVQKNKAKFIYQIKQLSNEQYKAIYEASDANGKKALDAARFANDDAYKAQIQKAKEIQSILNKNEKSQQEINKIILEGKDSAAKSTGVKSPDIQAEIDKATKAYQTIQNNIIKNQEIADKTAAEIRIKSLESIKDITANNEMISGSERLKIVSSIENQIAEIKYQAQIDSKVKELELEKKQAEERVQNDLKEINQKIKNSEKETDAKKKLSKDQITQLNDEAIRLQEGLNNELLSIDSKYYGQLNEIDNNFVNEQAKRVKENNKKVNDELEKEKINLIENSSQRQLAIELKALKTQFEAKLKDVKGNYNQELKIYEDYLAEKDRLETEQRIKSASGAEKLALDITDLLSKNAATVQIKTTDNSAQIEAEKKNFETSKAQFEKDLKEKKISYEQYLKEIAKLEGDHSNKIKELQANQIDGWKVVADIISKTFKDLADKKAIEVQGLLKSYTSLNSAIKQQGKVVEQVSEKNTTDSKEYAKAVEDLKNMQLQHAQVLQQTYQAVGEQVGASFVGMIASGESFSKALAKSALQGLKSIVPILIAEIFGQSIAQLGPIGGLIASAALSGVFYGLIAVAESSIGAEKGYLPGQKYGKRGKSDTQLLWVNPKEAIISAENYQRNKSIIDSIQTYGHPGSFNDNNIVKELQLTRKELAKYKSVEVYDRRIIDINDNRSVQVRSANLYR